MGAVKLYKYLDFTGGLMMLHYSNLQFTNATQLNDPFDCHPSLIDFSNVPKEACGGGTPEIIEELRRDPFRRTREEVWICSLSKIHDSILMWSYYSKHKGICIGLDMEKAQKYLSRIQGKVMIGCSEVEVQGIINDTDFIELQLSRPNQYMQDGVFFLTDETFWDKLILTSPTGMAIAFDTAIKTLDDNEPKLKNALPQQIFTKTALEPGVLKSVVDEINKIDPQKFNDHDLIGRVYEYFLQAFSINADKEEGEFYTPHSIVELIASLIEPFDGTVYDPCDTLEIRKKLIESDKVEAIIVLPRNMFYSTDISVTLWILNNNKKGGPWHGRQLRDRTGEILFIDLRTWNSNIYEKKYVRLSETEIDYKSALSEMSCKFDKLKKRWDANETELINAFKVLGYGEE